MYKFKKNYKYNYLYKKYTFEINCTSVKSNFKLQYKFPYQVVMKTERWNFIYIQIKMLMDYITIVQHS